MLCGRVLARGRLWFLLFFGGEVVGTVGLRVCTGSGVPRACARGLLGCGGRGFGNLLVTYEAYGRIWWVMRGAHAAARVVDGALYVERSVGCSVFVRVVSVCRVCC